METRASYIAVGTFVIVLLASLVLAVLWFAHGALNEHTERYETYFTSVGSGLSQGSSVRVSGVQLGHVISVALDPDNSTRVRVTMDIAASAPIRSNSVASLEIQSLAGTTAVEITPGSKDAPPIFVGPDQRYPVIWSRKSNLQQIVEAVPELVAKFGNVTERLGRLVDEKNLQAISDTLENLSQLTAVASAHREDLAKLLQESASDAQDLHQVIDNLNGVSQRLNKFVDQANQLTTQATSTVRDADGLIQENRGAVKSFTQDGLGQIQQLAVEARGLVAQLSRTVNSLNSDPSRLLYGDRREGYRPQ